MAYSSILPKNSKAIPLTQGMYAIVDEEDYNFLIQWKWYYRSNGYAARGEKINGKAVTIRLHRFILNAPYGMDVDHINGDGLDNRKCNLRICTRRQNICNQRTQKRPKSSKYKGVFWSSKEKKWCAVIKVNKKVIYLCVSFCEDQCAHEYNIAAIRFFGEYANLNRIEL